SAFIEQGVLQKEKKKGVPKNGWIYHIPFRDGIVDDYISARGLNRLTQKYLGITPDGAELFQLANLGNKNALLIFQKFGENLLEAVEPFLDEFEPDALVLGGQIAKSFPYFGNLLKAECEKRKIDIIISQDTSIRILQGLYKICLQKELDT
ncbi:MAG: ROK family protein, partial [Lachnospiraceae bacterium]